MLIPFPQFSTASALHERDIYIFDKDGTLTNPNQPLTHDQAISLAGFVSANTVVILTARGYDTCESHILSRLPSDTDLSHLVLACSNGSEIYRYTGGSYQCVSTLPGELDLKLVESAIANLNTSDDLHLTLESRSPTMATIVCIPRESSADMRQKYDPDRILRGKYRSILMDHLDIREIVVSGQTSIDLSLYTKYDGLQHIYATLGVSCDGCIYFGDNFAPDGNDTPILTDTIIAVEVNDIDVVYEFFSQITRDPRPRVVTIGGGNGHSNMLSGIYSTFGEDIRLSSIVSMSDDGRTTGRLMRYFHTDLAIHFPPPGDLRRCLYFLSASPYRDDFQRYFEMTIQDDIDISGVTLGDIARMVGAYDFLSELGFLYFDARLPLDHSLEGHKFGNICMGFIFYHLHGDYDAMLDAMHLLMDVRAHVIPVTTDRAYIQATLADGTVIERQDNISNVCGYDSHIVDLSLMSDSTDARHKRSITHKIRGADYIVLAPGDLYTSTISNLIIAGMKELITNSSARIIYVANTTNKGGETSGYAIMDFVRELERYLGRPIDIIIVNQARLDLSVSELSRLQGDISVKGGHHIYLSAEDIHLLVSQGIEIIQGDLLDRTTLYKHDTIALANILANIIKPAII